MLFFQLLFSIAILWGAVLWPNVSNAKNEQPERNKRQSKRGLQTNSLEDFFCWIAKFNYNEKQGFELLHILFKRAPWQVQIWNKKMQTKGTDNHFPPAAKKYKWL